MRDGASQAQAYPHTAFKHALEPIRRASGQSQVDRIVSFRITDYHRITQVEFHNQVLFQIKVLVMRGINFDLDNAKFNGSAQNPVNSYTRIAQLLTNFILGKSAVIIQTGNSNTQTVFSLINLIEHGVRPEVYCLHMYITCTYFHYTDNLPEGNTQFGVRTRISTRQWYWRLI